MTDWWRRAVFYHVYVRSFFDANGDGIGDLPGLLHKLDHIADLGIDAVWLSPCCPSPQKDFGYDVADYRDVDPAYGSLDDLARLRDALHGRGMRLILDFVPNHTSDQHSWFVEACSSRTARTRSWYLWADPSADGGPPNNWASIFGGPAWRWHEPTGQYFLHSFLREQPDLNWRDPMLVAAMHDTMRWWLRWGVDGFRVDAIPHLFKDPKLTDNPPDPTYRVPRDHPQWDAYRAQRHIYDRSQPEAFEAVAAMRRLVDETPGRVLIGETASDWEEYLAFLGDGGAHFHLAFNFTQLKAPSLPELRTGIEQLGDRLHPQALPTLAFSNHDVDRHATRLTGNHAEPHPEHDAVAKVAAALLLCSRGVPFVYYGEEVGMANALIPEHRVVDPVGLYERERRQRIFFSGGFPSYGRDPARTPMPWTEAGGFTDGEPWLPVGDTSRNVAWQSREPASVLSWYRALITLRRARPSLHSGASTRLDGPEGVWLVRRSHGDEATIVAANLTDAPCTVTLPTQLRPLLGTHRAEGSGLQAPLELAPYEVVVAG